MSESKRAIRRHHRERLNKRTRKILLDHILYSQFVGSGWDEDIEYRVNRRRDNLAGCSCYICCNPRSKRSLEKQKLTFKELTEKERELYDWQELIN